MYSEEDGSEEEEDMDEKKRNRFRRNPKRNGIWF